MGLLPNDQTLLVYPTPVPSVPVFTRYTFHSIRYEINSLYHVAASGR
jgi:hypothetical protein